MIGYKCLSWIDGAEISNDKFGCVGLRVYNQVEDIFENYHSPSNVCSFDKNSLVCSAYVQIASVLDKTCECNSGYYEDLPSNSCKEKAC